MSFVESYLTPPSANSTRITYHQSGQVVESNGNNSYSSKMRHSSYIATPAATSTDFIKNYLGKTTVNSTATSTSKTMEKSTYTEKSSYKLTYKTISKTEDQFKSIAKSTTTTSSSSSKESATINISVISTSTATATSNNVAFKSSKIIRKSVGSKKPVVVRKSITAKTSSEAPKPVGNCKTVQGIEKVLKQIKMTKYTQSFKKVDFEKFKELREIDLNAIGITRPSEIKIFKEAINKAKSEKY